MSDWLDEAADMSAREREASIARARMPVLDGPPTMICVDCGDGIPADRLEALPYACRCVDCQERMERACGGRK